MSVDPRDEHAAAKKEVDESLTAIGVMRKELLELSSAFALTGNYGMRDKCARFSEDIIRIGRSLACALTFIERADLAVQTERQNNGHEQKGK